MWAVVFLCPSSIRLRCPDHETSHWLLLTCGWTSSVPRSQMIVHCSGWPMISKPRTAEFALHFIFINFIKGANSYLTLSKVFVNHYDTQVSVRGKKCVLLLLSLTAFRWIIGGVTLWPVTTASSLSLSVARSDHISQTNRALELRRARAWFKTQSVSAPLENNRTT